jgi:hypothetical protein
MDFDSLSDVKFGDEDSLRGFLFANGLQHQLFRNQFSTLGFQTPSYPLFDVDISNLDDWLQMHQVEHQAFASLLGLDNPFNMQDADWNKEDQFYDWLATHLFIHQQIAANLALS